MNLSAWVVAPGNRDQRWAGRLPDLIMPAGAGSVWGKIKVTRGKRMGDC